MWDVVHCAWQSHCWPLTPQTAQDCTLCPTTWGLKCLAGPRVQPVAHVCAAHGLPHGLYRRPWALGLWNTPLSRPTNLQRQSGSYLLSLPFYKLQELNVIGLHKDFLGCPPPSPPTSRSPTCHISCQLCEHGWRDRSLRRQGHWAERRGFLANRISERISARHVRSTGGFFPHWLG